MKQMCKQCVWLADTMWRQPPSRTALALHTSNLESFWINTGLSRTIKNAKLVLEIIRKRLGAVQTWSDLQK